VNKKCIVVTILSLMQLCHNLSACEFQGISFFSPRSQGANNARRLSSWHCYRDIDQNEALCTAILVTPSYAHSQRAERIAQVLFGNGNIVIQGSQVIDRDTCALIADYFGLSPDFQSSVEIVPNIRNRLIDCEFHVSLGETCPALYLQLNLPIVYTKWHLKMVETILNGSSNSPFNPLYMDEGAVDPAITSFTQAWNGAVTFGQMTEQQRFGILNCPRTAHGIANLMTTVGYHVILCDAGRADIALQITAPTGTRPESHYFFEPIAGNGRHLVIGVDLAGDWLLWERECMQEVRLFGDVTFSTLCKSRQKRSFDIRDISANTMQPYNNFGTRFLLLKEFDGNTYTKHLVRAINHTTLACNVSVDLEIDIAIMGSYTYCNTFFDLGYNGWIRSKEKISLHETPRINNLGIKGLQNVAIAPSVVNNETQSNATLFGTETPTPDVPSPQFLSAMNIDLRSAASPRLITHKLFFNLGSFGSRCEYNSGSSPHVFACVGGELEFQAINPRTNPKPVHTTMSQWEIYLKIGYVFF